MESTVRNYCSEFLGDVWQTFTDQIIVERFKTGMVNRSFRCSLKVNDNVQNVVVKLYGTEVFSEEQSTQFKCHCEAAEAVIFDRLGSHKLAPKLLGVFNGGRIEEYIHGRNVTVDDLKDISMYEVVARKLAHFHSQQMPITKRPLFIPMLEEMIDKKPNDVSRLSVAEQNIMQNIEEFQLKNEFLWSLRLGAKCNSKIVFSHNDLFLPNTLLKYEGETLFDRFLIIDYESSDYNYRGTDLAQFLYANEFDMVADATEFSMKYIGNTVTETLKKTFAEQYLNELKAIGELGDGSYDNVDHLVMEIEVFGLQLYLVLLSFVRVAVYYSDSVAGPLEYVNDIIQLYNSLKRHVVTKYPQLV